MFSFVHYKMPLNTSALTKFYSSYVRSDPGLSEGSSSCTLILPELEESWGTGRATSTGAHEDSLSHYFRSTGCGEGPEQCPTEGLW